MSTKTNIQLIEDTVAGKAFRLAGISNSAGGLKKVYIGENLSGTWVEEQFPGTEVVQDVASIIEDKQIDLVLLSETQKEQPNFVADIINSGKNVRIV